MLLFYQIFGNTTATHRVPEQQEVKTKAGSKVPPLLLQQIRLTPGWDTQFSIYHIQVRALSFTAQSELLQTSQL